MEVGGRVLEVESGWNRPPKKVQLFISPSPFKEHPMTPRESALQRPVDILLVEDNPGDVRLTMEALKDCKVRNHTSVVGDGVDALAFLRRTGQYANAARPDLILLDLNLPKMNGHDVLSHVKKDPDLKQIPVVIFTGSKAPADVFKSYELYANCYVTKPVDVDRFNETVQTIQEFWCSVARLPNE